jgi:hypothetical protein
VNRVRGAGALLVVLVLGGCATTVQRLDGQLPSPVGAAQNACESERWLVAAPSRYRRAHGAGTELKGDGIGVYRVGSDSPESIPALGEELGSSAEIERHGRAVRAHDRDRFIAAGLGGAGIVALGIGAALFAGSFETQRERQADGSFEERQQIESGTLVLGSVLGAVGFGLGIAGIIVNPNARERAEADSWRYVFVPGRDDTDTATKLVDGHNRRVRASCAR